MINISWQHAAAGAPAFAPLLPKSLEAIDRWAEVVGPMATDEFSPFYSVQIREGIKYPSNQRLRVLRPATLRLGAMKALQDANDHWRSWDEQLLEVFTQVAGNPANVHDPRQWSTQTLDFVVQLAWFREVLFA